MQEQLWPSKFNVRCVSKQTDVYQSLNNRKMAYSCDALLEHRDKRDIRLERD